MPHPVPLPKLLSALGMLACICGSCSLYGFRAKATENISVDYQPATPVQVTASNGSIQLLGGAVGNQVHVTATITTVGTTQEEADARLEGVRIHCDRDQEGWLKIFADSENERRGSEGVSFVVRVPDADGARLRTSNGSIKVHQIAGHLDVHTSNGRIEVVDHSGRVDLHTSNGSMKVRDVAGPVTARSSNAGIDVQLRPEATGPVNLRTSNGRINLVVGAAFCGPMEVDTSNGRVRLQNELDRPVRGDVRRRHAELRFGEGGEASRLRSSNGTITVTVR